LYYKKNIQEFENGNVDVLVATTIIENGIDIGGYITQPAKVKKLTNKSLELTIKEGKFHQVKRMVKACGKTVVDLQRISMGPLHLEESLKLGEFRGLNDSELEALKIFNVEL